MNNGEAVELNEMQKQAAQSIIDVNNIGKPYRDRVDMMVLAMINGFYMSDAVSFCKWDAIGAAKEAVAQVDAIDKAIAERETP